MNAESSQTDRYVNGECVEIEAAAILRSRLRPGDRLFRGVTRLPARLASLAAWYREEHHKPDFLIVRLDGTVEETEATRSLHTPKPKALAYSAVRAHSHGIRYEVLYLNKRCDSRGKSEVEFLAQCEGFTLTEVP